MSKSAVKEVRVKVVGVGGGGSNAVQRISNAEVQGLGLLAINTDAQALSPLKNVPTVTIGPSTARGMGSGGNPEVGRRAVRESQEQVAQFVKGSDMVFVTAGMGGGTGTGAAPIVAELARRQGALVVGVVTRPFSFEGPRRMEVADRGLQQLQERVDTLITVENDRLLSSLDGNVSLEKAFQLADDVLRQGVQGVSEILTVPGMINVDFADVKAVMADSGPSFMALGEGKGKQAAMDAAQAALSNPLFDAPLEGCSGILFNLKGGKDLTLAQVHEVARTVMEASRSQAQVIFGVVQERKWKRRVSITLVATRPKAEGQPVRPANAQRRRQPHNLSVKPATNGHNATIPMLSR